MKRLFLSLLVLMCLGAKGQDPAFAQFFSSPLNINPALTANINADWRFISNYRDQWIGPGSPYATGTASFDSKIFQDKIMNVADRSYMGVGGMVMYDYAMSGIQRSMYASLDVSYNILLAEFPATHRLAAGFGGTYGRRSIDYSRVDFEEQWIGLGGFDTDLPTGEASLAQMKGWLSASAGLTYTLHTDKSNFDIGVAGYHLNRPKQTFLEDPNQYVPIRQVAHANFETLINEQYVFNMAAIYQRQADTRYFSAGALVGHYIGYGKDMLLNLGVWYWSDNAIVPYVGLMKGRFQFGMSSDITINQLNRARTKPGTFELSLIIRGERQATGLIHCPWK
ncbi:MAG: PorP/SprF family type IX secretion system membrane protein [Flavisolibacter sp.]